MSTAEEHIPASVPNVKPMCAIGRQQRLITLRETADILLEQVTGKIRYWITDKTGFSIDHEDDDGHPVHRSRQLTQHTFFYIEWDIADLLARDEQSFNRMAARLLGLTAFDAKCEFPPTGPKADETIQDVRAT